MNKLTDSTFIEKVTKALELEGSYTLEEVLGNLRGGKMQMFYNDDGCYITSVISNKNKKWLNVIAIAGELSEDLENQATVFAKSKGCTEIVATANLSWRNDIKKLNWNNTALIIKKAI